VLPQHPANRYALRNLRRFARTANRLRTTMRNGTGQRLETQMNRAIPRRSSPLVATVEPACQAGREFLGAELEPSTDRPITMATVELDNATSLE
jgi:hypothetical protein